VHVRFSSPITFDPVLYQYRHVCVTFPITNNDTTITISKPIVSVVVVLVVVVATLHNNQQLSHQKVLNKESAQRSVDTKRN
jgi:hypothetical protein